MYIKQSIHMLAAVLTGFFVTIYPYSGFAAEKINIKDILDSPEAYYWQDVKIEGEVIEIEHSEQLFQGHYILKDKNDDTIKIQCNNLPPVDTKLVVRAAVKPGKETSSIRIEELERHRPDSWLGNVVFSAAFVMMGIMLILGMHKGRKLVD